MSERIGAANGGRGISASLSLSALTRFVCLCLLSLTRPSHQAKWRACALSLSSLRVATFADLFLKFSRPIWFQSGLLGLGLAWLARVTQRATRPVFVVVVVLGEFNNQLFRLSFAADGPAGGFSRSWLATCLALFPVCACVHSQWAPSRALASR